MRQVKVSCKVDSIFGIRYLKDGEMVMFKMRTMSPLAEYKARSKQQTLRMMSHGPAHQVHHAAHKRGRGAPMPKLGHGFVQHTAAPVKKGPNHLVSETRTYKNIMVG